MEREPLKPSFFSPQKGRGEEERRASIYLSIHNLSAVLLGRVAADLPGLVTLLELSVRSYLVGNAGSRPISEAKQPWACLVLRWGTTGEAHVLYSPILFPSGGREAGWQSLAVGWMVRVCGGVRVFGVRESLSLHPPSLYQQYQWRPRW